MNSSEINRPKTRCKTLKVAFFDRDGTIIEDYPDDEWTHKTSPVFIPNAIQTLKSVRQKGYEIIILTNQYLINEGYITLEQYHMITDKMLVELSKHSISVLDIFYCPHKRDEGCSCMKPKTGMIEQAIEKYPTIKIDQSFMVGDSSSDLDLAATVKMKGFGIGVGSSFLESQIYQLNELKDLLRFI